MRWRQVGAACGYVFQETAEMVSGNLLRQYPDAKFRSAWEPTLERYILESDHPTIPLIGKPRKEKTP